MTQRLTAPRDPKRALFAAAILLGVAAVCGVLLFADKETIALFPPCPFHWITGLWCPGCGSGRAFRALLHGEILRALDHNPLMVLSLPFLAYAGASGLLLSFRGKGLPRMLHGRYWGWFVVSLVIVYWVVRNIPAYPFSILAP